MPIINDPYKNLSGVMNAIDYGAGVSVNTSQWSNHLNLNSINMDDLKKLKEAMDKYNKPRESTTVADEGFRMKAIGMRLRLTQGERFPFDHFNTAHSGDKVFAFLVVKGQPVVLEDESVMFPSDTFMTQIRMLMD